MAPSQPENPSHAWTGRVRRVGGRAIRRARRAGAAGAAQAEDRALVASGLFVPEFYGRQVGREFSSDLEAARHYLRTGAARGAIPNPLQDFWSAFPGRVPGTEVADLLVAGEGASIPALPDLDVRTYLESAPAAADHPGGVVAHFLQAALTGTGFPLQRHGKVPTTFAKELDRARRHAKISRAVRKSGLFDAAWYSEQTGRDYRGLEPAAIWNYLQHGEHAHRSPHVLFEPSWYREQAGIKRVEALWHYLRHEPASTSPQFDAVAWAEQHPEAVDADGGVLGHFLAQVDPAADLPAVEHVRPTSLEQLTEGLRRVERERVALLDASTPDPFSLVPGFPAAPADAPRVDVVTDAATWSTSVDVLPALPTVLAQEGADVRLTVVVTRRLGHVDERTEKVLEQVLEKHPDLDLAPATGRTVGERLNEVLPTLDGDVVMLWGGGEHWNPRVAATLAARAGRSGTAACVLRHAHRQREHRASHLPPHVAVEGPLAPVEAFAWSSPRGLGGFALGRDWLGSEPFDPTMDHVGWELLVRRRADVEPAFVPSVGVEDRGLEPTARVDYWATRATSDHNVVRARHTIDWDALRRDAGDRVPGRVSALIPTWRDWRMTRRAVRNALEHRGDVDLEVVVLDNGSDRDVAALLHAEFGDDPAVVVVPCVANTHYSTGSNLAFARSTGEVSIFLNNDTIPGPGWLPPLLEALERPGVVGSQPLLLYPDGSIQTAGTVFHGPSVLPWHFLSGHPVEDAPTGTVTDFAAITGACLMMRSDHVALLEGMDPVFVNGLEDVDFCLRARRLLDGSFAVASDSRVLHDESRTPGRHFSMYTNHVRFIERWLRDMPGEERERFVAAGFELSHIRIGSVQPLETVRFGTVQELIRPRRTVQDGERAGLPVLRWALKVDVEADPFGEEEVDPRREEAARLAVALRELDQEVVVDHKGAHVRTRSDYLDDVQLTLRQETPLAQQPAATSVLWTLGDTDDVTDIELASYDLLLAADDTSAQALTDRSGREVTTLPSDDDVQGQARRLLRWVLDARGVEHHLPG